MKEYYELIKKIELADQVNKEIAGNFGRTMTITMGEALMIKHLLENQANGVDTSHETALRKHAVSVSVADLLKPDTENRMYSWKTIKWAIQLATER